MNIKIRFLSNDECKGTIHYYDSNFLISGNAENISDALVERMDEVCNKNCIMLLMDGPKTNWSVLDKISSLHKQMEFPIFF